MVVPIGEGRVSQQQLISSQWIGGGEIQIGTWGIFGLEIGTGGGNVSEVGR